MDSTLLVLELNFGLGYGSLCTQCTHTLKSLNSLLFQVQTVQLASLPSNLLAYCPGHTELLPNVDLHDLQCMAVSCCGSGCWFWIFCFWMEDK